MHTTVLCGTDLQLRSPGVVAIGAPLVDLIVHVDDAFLEKLSLIKGRSSPVDSSVLALILGELRSGMKRTVGGSALNVAFVLARLSGRTAFIGKLGVDYEGMICRKQMREAGVTSWLLVDKDQPTGRVLCLVTPDGERTMLADLGASTTMEAEELSGFELHRMGIAHFEGYQIGKLDFCQRVMAMAKGQGALISLDLASTTWVEVHLHAFHYLIAGWVDILFGNYDEMSALTGLDDPYQICESLGRMLRWVFLTSGSKGVWCSIQGQVFHFPVTQIEPLDTTGAGDFFCAGILHAIRWGWTLEEGIQLACFLASEVIQVDGAKLPTQAWDRVFANFQQLLDIKGKLQNQEV